MRRTSFKKKNFSLPFCRCVRPRDFCDFFSLSTALSPDKRGEKIRHVWRDGRSLSLIRVQPTKSTPKRSHWDEKVALRRNRSRSRRYQQQESSLLTRASFALHSRTPIRSCESARFPSFVVFCYAVDNGGKKIWADEFMRKKPNQSTFFAKTYD